MNEVTLSRFTPQKCLEIKADNQIREMMLQLCSMDIQAAMMLLDFGHNPDEQHRIIACAEKAISLIR